MVLTAALVESRRGIVECRSKENYVLQKKFIQLQNGEISSESIGEIINIESSSQKIREKSAIKEFLVAKKACSREKFNTIEKEVDTIFEQTYNSRYLQQLKSEIEAEKSGRVRKYKDKADHIAAKFGSRKTNWVSVRDSMTDTLVQFNFRSSEIVSKTVPICYNCDQSVTDCGNLDHCPYCNVSLGLNLNVRHIQLKS